MPSEAFADGDVGEPTSESWGRPLLETLPIDQLIATSRRWRERDVQYSKELANLESGLNSLRSFLRSQMHEPVEHPSPTLRDGPGAMAIIERATTAFTQAIKQLDEAGAELSAAHRDAELALRECRDVLLARRMITVVVVVCFLIILRMMFGG